MLPARYDDDDDDFFRYECPVLKLTMYVMVFAVAIALAGRHQWF